MSTAEKTWSVGCSTAALINTKPRIIHDCTVIVFYSWFLISSLFQTWASPPLMLQTNQSIRSRQIFHPPDSDCLSLGLPVPGRVFNFFRVCAVVRCSPSPSCVLSTSRRLWCSICFWSNNIKSTSQPSLPTAISGDPGAHASPWGEAPETMALILGLVGKDVIPQ